MRRRSCSNGQRLCFTAGLCAYKTGGHARAEFSHGASLTYRGQIQVGSLTGAVHLSNDNAGVPRPAPCGRKSRMEYKDQSWLDLDFQYEYGRRKPGLSILLMLRSL